jgi:tRNA pseudouridine55 synthase
VDTSLIILINKPYKWTSFDVVRKIKNVLASHFGLKPKKFKVGHAGTLDPLATGLLILCTGAMTKKISEIQDAEKEYEGSFFIGATTESHDMERGVNEHFSIQHIEEALIYETAKSFIGRQMQTPPAHSAVKVNGKRAYELARKGEEVSIKEKSIEIKEFEITKVEMPLVYFRIVCSKGTYIRSLANDFGKRVGSGAYLASLERTRIGKYLLKDAVQPEDFIQNLAKSADNAIDKG